MDALSAWVKNLIFLILFAAFFELLLPNRGMKNFLRVVIGLFVLLAILRPLADFLTEDFEPDDLSALPVLRQEKKITVSPSAAPADQRRAVLAREVYVRELERRLCEAVEKLPEVKDAQVSVRLSGAPSETAQADLIDAVAIRVTPDNEKSVNVKIQPIDLRKKDHAQALSSDLENKIKQRAAALLQISAERISVNLKE